ncbi:hypothetical protein [Pararhodobacter zhoushanensis]|uniref:Uncharacterized protein n=1 Tax=Pararhodobacter zhoushanensis TaxID=2479545 RepID=A0ABT3GZZ1_9RHOB|nr:hypothetical protein [Pararhodobacter zhoushanensis]MCW1933070.1 hypothetical protein [Pararhodobacter zhoushanensis]
MIRLSARDRLQIFAKSASLRVKSKVSIVSATRAGVAVVDGVMNPWCA